MHKRIFGAAISVSVLAAALASCGNPASELEGKWVSASMRDALGCGMGRAIIIDGDRVLFGVGGYLMKEFDNLEGEVLDNGHVVLKSDTAKFEIAPGEEDGQMTLITGPFVPEHFTTRLPQKLARC